MCSSDLACDARRNKDFLIIARTDARAIEGLDGAIARANAYVEAGADAIFVEALLSEEEMRAAAKAIKAPLQANMSEGGGKTPVIHYDTLYDIGFKIISYSGLMQRSGIKAMQGALGVLRTEGSAESLYPEKLCSLVERSELLGLHRFYQLEERLYGPLLESEGSWRGQLEKNAGASGKDDRLPI